MSIPKIIHACWLSGDALPELQQRCVASWKKYLPDFEIKIWNAQTWDASPWPFAVEAIAHRQWAFASDVCRLDVLHRFGGIYFDLDVEVKKPFDRFMHHTFFTGSEDWGSGVYTNTPYIMGAVPMLPLVKEFLDFYDGKHFVNPNGSFNREVNTKYIGKTMLAHGGIDEPGHHEFKPGYVKYPPSVLGANYPDTCAVHWCDGAWRHLPDRFERTVVDLLKKNCDCGTKRYGPNSDGGYVVPDICYDQIITIGVGGNVQFEADYAKAFRTTKFALYDPTVIGLPQPVARSSFHKTGLGTAPGCLDLNAILKRHPGRRRLLKIDCEGGEWEGGVESADFAGVVAIVLEAHDLQDLAKHETYCKVLRKIRAEFWLCNAHPNNHGSTFEFEGEQVPCVMELTFLRKETRVPGAQAANYPCNPDAPEIIYPVVSQADIFDGIYLKNSWVYGSGTGSTEAYTEGFRVFLADYLRAHRVKSILDIGCGDWQWMRLMDLTGIDYTGMDVAPSVVAEASRKYQKDGVAFHTLPSDGPLPTADLVIVKDVLQHLSFASAKSLMELLPKCCRVLFVNDESEKNIDCRDGGYRPVNIGIEPFSMSAKQVFRFEGKHNKIVYEVDKINS